MVEFSINKVKGLMAENGYKQIDMADKLNLSLIGFQTKLNGKTEFKVSEVKELARIFNVEFIITNN